MSELAEGGGDAVGYPPVGVPVSEAPVTHAWETEADVWLICCTCLVVWRWQHIIVSSLETLESWDAKAMALIDRLTPMCWCCGHIGGVMFAGFRPPVY